MFVEDLDAFFDTDAHATDATYNAVTAVKIIFDAAYVEALGVSSVNPMATGKASDFPVSTVIGKTLLINGVTYKIRGREPIDDGALVLLQLEAQ